MWFRWDDLDQNFSALEEFRHRMERLFDDAEWERQTGATRRSYPAVGLRDRGDRLELKADLPGMTEKEITLTLNAETMTLSGERKVDVPTGYRIHRQERIPYRFARSYMLPCKVDPEKVKATLVDGVLTVNVEKAREHKPRAVTVTAG